MLLKIRVGILDTNCYIYSCDSTDEAVIIDPGGAAQEILNTIKINNLSAKYIILTHGHFDHILDAGLIREHTGAKILIHENDKECLLNPLKNQGYLFGLNTTQIEPDQLLKDGDIIKLGEIELKVIHTPGHSPGGIVILHDKILFSGDLIFHGAVGRTDLLGGDYKALMKSIKNKILLLDNDTIVYPGHGTETTIENEKRIQKW